MTTILTTQQTAGFRDSSEPEQRLDKWIYRKANSGRKNRPVCSLPEATRVPRLANRCPDSVDNERQVGGVTAKTKKNEGEGEGESESEDEGESILVCYAAVGVAGQSG